MSQGIQIKVRLEGDQKVFSKLGRLMKGAVPLANELTANYGKKYSQAIVNKFKRLIDVKSGIGATGASAENHIITSGSSNGAMAWEINIGPNASGNFAIRYGIAPGSKPSLSALRAWAAHRGISILHPDAYNSDNAADPDQIGGTKMYAGYITKKGTKVDSYGRTRYGRSKKATTAGLSAIRNSLYTHGTLGKPGHHWNPRYPKGQSRFDYVTYGLNTMQMDVLSITYDDEVVRVLAEYLGSGRKKKLTKRLVDYSL